MSKQKQWGRPNPEIFTAWDGHSDINVQVDVGSATDGYGGTAGPKVLTTISRVTPGGRLGTETEIRMTDEDAMRFASIVAEMAAAIASDRR